MRRATIEAVEIQASEPHVSIAVIFAGLVTALNVASAIITLVMS